MKTNYFKSLLIALFLGGAFVSYSQIISTITGDSAQGFYGDGGQATNSELSNPNGIAVDALGNVYIADASNNRIRKVNTSGIISTFAGNGTAAFSGDGGQATAAEFHLPVGVAVDTLGIVYIVDQYNGCIRIVDTSGIISTFAGNGIQGYCGDGGTAIAAELFNPAGVAIDKHGNVYIADGGNNRVRKVNTSDIISTFAGNGIGNFSGDGGQATTAELYNPVEIALDASGDFYIADQFNDRIRKVNSSGIINTFGGNGTAAFSGDGGQATAAEMNVPWGVTLDAIGNVYVADEDNNRIRIINTSGIINTLAGNGTGGFSGDGGLAISAELSIPIGVALDNYGNIYIGDAANNRIRKVSVSTGINGPSLVSNDVNIYPIPTTGSFTVSGSAPGQVIELYDYMGQKVNTQLTMDNGQCTINIAGRANGIYLVRILNKDGSIAMIKKIVKTY